MTPEEFWKWDREETLKELNRRYGVIESVDDFKGWHLAGSAPYKPGVLRITLTCANGAGYRMFQGFCSVQLLTTARELGHIAKSNGDMLP